MNDNKKIVLIGAGGIGYRHFQSLMDISFPIELVVVDLNKNALERVKSYASANIHKPVQLTCFQDTNSLPAIIDVLIIATSSLVRFKLFKDIVETSDVKNIIFEKFLFPQTSEYDHAFKILREKKIHAFVNTPCRLYPGYITLKEKLNGINYLNVYVSGSNWGLACNIIHTIDVIAYLTDSCNVLISDGTMLDNSLLKSKRDNYIEFTGRMYCQLENSANIILDSESTGESIYKTTIYAEDTIYTISETEQRISITKKGITITQEFPVYYQSQLTARVVEDLILNHTCGLTKYEYSMQWHISLLNAFLKKYNSIIDKDQTICPIT